MQTFKKFINATSEDERALVDITNNEVVIKGDYYHDKIDEKIEGFFIGLDFCTIEYELQKSEYITPDNEMFKKIGFYEE